MINYGFTKELIIPFEKTVEIVTQELKKQGFVILTKIDLKEKFKEKLGINSKKYVILGTCNPSHALEAILAEKNIGLMLPCNVIVYENGDNTAIAIIRPTVAMGMINNEKLEKIAASVEYQLKQAFDSIA